MKIWSLGGPKVVKMFMWQACNNFLPMNENLFKRKVLSDPVCPICKSVVESLEIVDHALWSCSTAQAVWNECVRKIQKSSMVEESFLDTFEGMLRRLDKEDVDMLACIARQMWLRRNKWAFQGEFATPTHILQCALNHLGAAKSNGERLGVKFKTA